MAYDGTEIINSARFAAYMGNEACGSADFSFCVPCPELVAEVSDPPFFNPVVDQAPWYDPAMPISADFLGVGGIDIEGLWMQPSALVDGVTVRDMAVRVLLGARSEAAMSYGLGWLSVALGGSYCPGAACVGAEMCVAVSCPQPAAPDPVRTLMDAFVLEKPEVVEIQRVGQFLVWEVEFTMRSRNRYLYQDATIALTAAPAMASIQTVNLIDAYANCGNVVPCATDPQCPRPELPVIPQPPLDACYPVDDFAAHRTMVSIDGASVPAWLDLVPVITISAGATALRNITIRFYQNPLGLDCDDLAGADPCAACTDITVLYVPPNGTLTIDGRIRRAITRCLGGDVDVPALYGPAGRTFSWPSFSCNYGLCVEMLTAAGAAADAEITVELATQWEAA